MLPITPKPFRINVSNIPNEDKELFNIVVRINSTWSDIESLNYLFVISMGRLTDERSDVSKEFTALNVISQSFYIYFDIIRKLIERLNKRKNKFQENKELFIKIRKIRNSILIHKEKDWFIQPTGVITYTSKGGGILNKLVISNDEIIEFDISKDINDMLDILNSLNEKIIQFT